MLIWSLQNDLRKLAVRQDLLGTPSNHISANAPRRDAFADAWYETRSPVYGFDMKFSICVEKIEPLHNQCRYNGATWSPCQRAAFFHPSPDRVYLELFAPPSKSLRAYLPTRCDPWRVVSRTVPNRVTSRTHSTQAHLGTHRYCTNLCQSKSAHTAHITTWVC